MIELTGFLLSVLLGAACPAVSTNTPAVSVVPGDAFDSLEADYLRELKEWKAKVRAAKNASERRELRKQGPGLTFWPRFRDLEAGGDMDALLWLLENTDASGEGPKGRSELLMELYTRMVTAYAEHPEFASGLDAMFEDRRLRKRDDWSRLDSLVERVSAATQDPQAKVALQFRVALLDLRSKVAERRDAGIASLDRLVEDPLLAEADRSAAKKRLFSIRNLQVGCKAPAFSGQTPDGKDIALSDYEGRVVLLDFFGFW